MNYLILKTTLKYKDRLLLKCYKNNIYLYEIKEDKNNIYIKINSKDYAKIKKFYFTKFKIVNQTGYPKLKQYLKKYHIILLALIIGLILFYFLSHIMVDVKVIHSNKDIRQLVTNALYNEGIKKNTWKKNYQQLQQIKEKILALYPTKLEWLEIEVHGMNYLVRVEERKIVSEDTEMPYCHIIAKKDGLIKKVLYSKGEALVKTNDYVKKDDILITGIISKDNVEKKQLCASGQVYAEVWYKAKISLPKEEIIEKPTGKVRFNFKLKNNNNDYLIFKSRLTNYIIEEKPILTLFGYTISFIKQIEVYKETNSYSNEELAKKAQEQLENKFNQILQDDEQITFTKILTEEEDTQTNTYQFFVITLEQIGQAQAYEKSDTNLEQNNTPLTENE